jgi:ubiquinone/menaquinone biosynthesis C-methylase UbiE
MTRRRFVVAGLGGLLLLLLAMSAGRTLAFHVLPLRWTGEAQRLARALDLTPRAVVAEIGAGDGEMAVEIARMTGESAVVYATELTAEQRADISRAASSAGISVLRVVAAEERSTGLPAVCCDAVYMRNVFHHIGDRTAYARELRKVVKPGGRLAIIDFTPATFFHLAGNHGVTPEEVIATMTSAGFRVERRVDDWGGGLFLVLFAG